ncbi:MAG TPA: hypothetical protein VGL13_00240, partial [Polyangiaceae bacterium]
MKIDPDLWLLGAVGSTLLAVGGAVLRSAWATVPAPTRLSNPPAPSPDAGDAGSSLGRAQAEIADLKSQLSAAETHHEAQRAEMVEQRQRAERQVQGAQAEIQRLTQELETERSQPKTSEGAAPAAPQDDDRQQLQAATEERDAARSKVEALERLMEGVRARSRQLSEELKRLKG